MIVYDAYTGKYYNADPEELKKRLQEISKKIDDRSNDLSEVWNQIYKDLDDAIDKMDIDEDTKSLMKDRDHGWESFEEYDEQCFQCWPHYIIEHIALFHEKEDL